MPDSSGSFREPESARPPEGANSRRRSETRRTLPGIAGQGPRVGALEVVGDELVDLLLDDRPLERLLGGGDLLLQELPVDPSRGACASRASSRRSARRRGPRSPPGTAGPPPRAEPRRTSRRTGSGEAREPRSWPPPGAPEAVPGRDFRPGRRKRIPPPCGLDPREMSLSDGRTGPDGPRFEPASSDPTAARRSSSPFRRASGRRSGSAPRQNARELAGQDRRELRQGLRTRDRHRALDARLAERGEEGRGAARPVRVAAAMLGHQEGGQPALVPGLGHGPGEVRPQALLLDGGVLVRRERST